MGVANLVEKMGVDVERRAHLRVPEYAADLSDIQTQVDDQVARKRMPEVVKAQGGARLRHRARLARPRCSKPGSRRCGARMEFPRRYGIPTPLHPPAASRGGVRGVLRRAAGRGEHPGRQRQSSTPHAWTGTRVVLATAAPAREARPCRGRNPTRGVRAALISEGPCRAPWRSASGTAARRRRGGGRSRRGRAPAVGAGRDAGARRTRVSRPGSEPSSCCGAQSARCSAASPAPRPPFSLTSPLPGAWSSGWRHPRHR